jgi:hypothetical protein
VLGSPFQHQRERSPRQAALDHVERANVDQRLMLGVERMEMRRPVVAPEDLDQDAVEGADRGNATIPQGSSDGADCTWRGTGLPPRAAIDWAFC